MALLEMTVTALNVEYHFLKGILGLFTGGLSRKDARTILNSMLTPLFFLIILLALFCLWIHWDAYNVWEKYIHYKYDHEPQLYKSGTPIYLYLYELILIHFLLIPLLVTVFVVAQADFSKITSLTSRAPVNKNRMLSIVGQYVRLCIAAHLIYLFPLAVFAFGILQWHLRDVFIFLAVQFFISWGCIALPVILLKFSFRRSLLVKALLVLHIVLVFISILFFIAITTGGFGLSLFKFWGRLFWAPRSDGTYFLYFGFALCMLHPLYLYLLIENPRQKVLRK